MVSSYIGINVDGIKAAIKGYSANVKGPLAVVKIEIAVTDPSYLGYLLEDLGRAKSEAERALANTKAEKVASEKRRPAGKPLALPYYGSGS